MLDNHVRNERKLEWLGGIDKWWAERLVRYRKLRLRKRLAMELTVHLLSVMETMVCPFTCSSPVVASAFVLLRPPLTSIKSM